VNQFDFPFTPIVSVPFRSLLLRKVKGKLHFIFKYLPIRLSNKRRNAYKKALIDHRINLMHVHFGVMAIELIKACEPLGIPLIVTFHGFDITSAVKRSPAYHRALNKLFDKTTIAIAISEEMKSRLIALGCPANIIRVSYL